MGKFKRKKKEVERKTIGCRVDVELWKQFKILAMQKDLLTENMLEMAIADYIKNNDKPS